MSHVSIYTHGILDIVMTSGSLDPRIPSLRRILQLRGEFFKLESLGSVPEEILLWLAQGVS